MIRLGKFFITFLLIIVCFAVNAPPGNSQNVYDSQARLRTLDSALPDELFDNTPLEPTKVFDNVYCVGSKSVAAWALTTSDGIILIDSMWGERDAKVIISGLKKLGLDPAQIKYILLTHGHVDHYGGAQYLKDRFNAKIFMSAVDEARMNADDGYGDKCKVDYHLTDGQVVALGDTKVTAVATPGHSPGCMSFVFPVKDKGTEYMLAIWGGKGAPKSLAAKLQYRQSLDHFAEYTKTARVNAEITAHLFGEKGYERLKQVRTRKDGEPNPFVLGCDGYASYLDGLRRYVDDEISRQVHN